MTSCTIETSPLIYARVAGLLYFIMVSMATLIKKTMNQDVKSR